jgi:hypothetical protein
MYVPNYVPEPLEVPGNVIQEHYAVRLLFIRRVVALHALGIAVLAGIACLPLPSVATWKVGLALLGFLVFLAWVRIFWRGREVEATTSAWMLPLLLFLVGWAARELWLEGYPVWAPGLGMAAIVVYTLLCGRDFSFVGCWFLALIASGTAIAMIGNAFDLGTREVGWALLANLVALTYWIYDLAYLGYRRRVGEEVAAVVDLYRDMLNIFGYVPRMIGHWRRHRIFAIPKDWLRQALRPEDER